MLFILLNEEWEEFYPQIYIKDRILSISSDQNLTKTWKYAPYLENKNIEYAYLYCKRKMMDVCTKDQLEKFKKARDRIKAFKNSFKNTGINSNVCLLDVVPEHFLLDYYRVKYDIIKYIFEKYKRPVDYKYLLELSKLVYDVGNKKLMTNIEDHSPYIKYNIFGTKTGRFTTEKNSFPILTLNKENRNKIYPSSKDSYFLAFDFNAAELRTLLSLTNKEQPRGDIHLINQRMLGIENRNDAKKKIFSWLYDIRKKNDALEEFYERDMILKKYYDRNKIINPFGRIIKCNKEQALNNLLQSTQSDIFLRQCLKIREYLKNKLSFISFMIHDSIIIDLHKEEKYDIIKELKDTFEQTGEFGRWVCSVSIGKNFGDMRKINI